MPTATALLDRFTSRQQSLGPLSVPLEWILSSFSRGFWVSGTPQVSIRLTPDHCRIIGSRQLAHYRLLGDEGWSSYTDIEAAFERRNQKRSSGKGEGGARTTPLPPEIVNANVKLMVRDQDDPIQCAVTAERVYPKRAWMGTLHDSLPLETTFVVAAILNSAIGQISYRRLAAAKSYRSADIRKGTLLKIIIPLLGYEDEAFHRSALLSYRLHCLHAAVADCSLPSEVTDIDIANNWIHLLSELVRLYGFSEPEARHLVAEVLPAGLKDVPGFQGKFYYVPRSPLSRVILMHQQEHDRYEELKGRARKRELSDDETRELARLQRLIAWEDKINHGSPVSVTPSPWPGADNEQDALKLAYGFLSRKRGQRFGATDPVRVSPRLWEVSTFYRPPRGVATGDMDPLPSEWAVDQRHPVGKLWIDAVTGEVQEAPSTPLDAGHAATS
jgi:hypothetical protein